MTQANMTELKHGIRSIINLALAGSRGKDGIPETPEAIRAHEVPNWVINAVGLALFSGSLKGESDPSYKVRPDQIIMLGITIAEGGNLTDIL